MDERLLNRILGLIRGVALGEIFEKDELDDLIEAIEAMNNPPAKAKPLLLVGCPSAMPADKFEYAKSKIGSEIQSDYHIILYHSTIGIDFSFQVFYEEDFDEIKYEELKQLISGLL